MRKRRCNISSGVGTELRRPNSRECGGIRLNVTQKLIWMILMAGLVGLLYLAFRGYLAPAMLIDFANSMLC